MRKEVLIAFFVLIAIITVFFIFKTSFKTSAVKKAVDNEFEIKKSTPPLGNSDAPVKIFVFGDYLCSHCKNFNETTLKYVKNEFVNKGLAVIYWKDLSFLHEKSLTYANAVRCAGEQNMFWIFHDEVFKNIENLFKEKLSLVDIAKKLGLDIEKFKKCVDEERYKNAIIDDVIEAQKLGVIGTPTTFVNSKKVEGAVNFQEIANVINGELKRK